MTITPDSPEAICRLFQQNMRAGDLDGVLNVYDPEIAFVNPDGLARHGFDELREELRPFAEANATFDFTTLQIVEADGIALMHTRWRIAPPFDLTTHAIEVARRQPDGSWRWLIGDPFTVGRHWAVAAAR